jgi:hypothetical protein
METAPYSLMAELDKAGVAEGQLPPIHLWNPDNVKDIDMRIAADGTWFYLGTPIKRPRLVKLFASVMRKEGADYYLVTPVEKCRVTVEDAPFLIVLLESTPAEQGERLELVSNMGDRVTLSKDCPLRVVIDKETEEPGLYVTIRADLEAKLNRNVYYQLTELLETQDVAGESWHGVVSSGDFLPIIRSSDLK